MTNNKAKGEALRLDPDSLERQPEDEEILGHLDKAATDLELTDRAYWVEASRSISLPVDFESDEEVRMINFSKLSFEGTFAC